VIDVRPERLERLRHAVRVMRDDARAAAMQARRGGLEHAAAEDDWLEWDLLLEELMAAGPQ
jgi:hypothetical protein